MLYAMGNGKRGRGGRREIQGGRIVGRFWAERSRGGGRAESDGHQCHAEMTTIEVTEVEVSH